VPIITRFSSFFSKSCQFEASDIIM